MVCMKTMPSTEFRKTYASITERVVVTVSGHPIGVWEPIAFTEQLSRGPVFYDLGATPVKGAGKEFRPVPKPGKRR